MRTLLIANRAEIARRVIRTARAMGIRTVAVYTEVDRLSPHVEEADAAVAISSYLDVAAIIEAARLTGAEAVHPGYGFLSERGAAAAAIAAAGLTWVGPPAVVIDALGDKVRAKQLMAAVGVPLVPGGTIDDAPSIGYPLLVKAAAGGGGRGMRLVERADDLAAAVEGAQREADAAFGDGTVFLERWVASPRHIEVQIVADSHGHVIHLGERECSIQRRHQKVIEESPSPSVDPALRSRLTSAAVDGAREVAYVGAGTWEFLVDRDEFFFLEVNTRLQVEHPVTEAVTGLDLVRLQLLIADGHELELGQDDVRYRGHAIEGRVVAEDPAEGWLPSVGTLHRFEPVRLPGVRYDLGVRSGSVVPPDYDSLLGKVIAHAPTRAEAAAALAGALRRLEVNGVQTNRDALAAILEEPDFLAGRTTTDYLDTHPAVLVGAGGDDGTRDRHLLAATLWSAAVRHRRAAVLGRVSLGFRNLRSQATTTTWVVGGTDVVVAYELDGDRYRATVEGEVHAGRVLNVGRATIDLEDGGLRIRATMHPSPDSLLVVGRDGQTICGEAPRFVEPGAAATAARGPAAPVPGTVVRVDVHVGDAVVAGQVLMILEAMKLEHRIRADVDGVVAEVPVAAGDKVDAHQVLVVLEASE